MKGLGSSHPLCLPGDSSSGLDLPFALQRLKTWCHLAPCCVKGPASVLESTVGTPPPPRSQDEVLCCRSLEAGLLIQVAESHAPPPPALVHPQPFLWEWDGPVMCRSALPPARGSCKPVSLRRVSDAPPPPRSLQNFLEGCSASCAGAADWAWA